MADSNLHPVFKEILNSHIHNVSDSLRYSEREIDFAYLAGVFNVSGIDGLQKEIARLKRLGKNPHDIIIAARQSEQFKCGKCSSNWGELRATCFNCGHESEDLST